MKVKYTTVPLGDTRALTFILNEDLGCYRSSKVHTSLLGISVDKGQRVDAMYRMNSWILHIGPFGISYTNVYERSGE